MNIHIDYHGQSRSCAGCETETVEIDDDADLRLILATLAERHGDAMRSLLFDAHGDVSQTMLVFLGDEQVDWRQPTAPTDGARVTLLSPISGGCR